jgi:hypothetical protein
VEDFEEEGYEETDEEIEFREENERQIAMMVVDALWQSQWIRGALQDYEYRGKGFDGLRQSFRMMPPESEPPNIPAIRWKLEELVLRELYERQVDMHGNPNWIDGERPSANYFGKGTDRSLRRLHFYGPARLQI